MIVSVASGKGGTGKTTIAVAFARAAGDSAYVDCDVEAPNGALLLNPEIEHTEEVLRTVARIDNVKCTFCGICADACVFSAIAIAPATHRTAVFDDLCNGCGVCSFVCPEDAISELSLRAGVVSDGTAGEQAFREGCMDASAPHAHPTLEATLETLPDKPIVVLDSEPGVTARVASIVRSSDVCVLVTEPTPYGLHDMKRAVELVRSAQIPMGVVINRSDVGDSSAVDYCREEGILVLLEIPFDRRIAMGYAEGRELFSVRPDLRSKFEQMIETLRDLSQQREVVA